ncbi:MAG: HEPN domain-containing protein [Candidatus Hydrogenedentota bacterium]
MRDEYRTEVAAYLKRAETPLHAARVLFDSALYDDVASRAYYAAFYAVSALLLSCGFAFKKHSAVISAFHREFVRTGVVGVGLSKSLGWLFELRGIGDYGEILHVPEEKARMAIEQAAQCVHAASELCK